MNGTTEKQLSEQGQTVRGIFSDVYKLYLKYHGKVLDEIMCQEKSEDAGRLLKKYGCSPFCDRMLLNVLMQLEEESR